MSASAIAHEEALLRLIVANFGTQQQRAKTRSPSAGELVTPEALTNAVPRGGDATSLQLIEAIKRAPLDASSYFDLGSWALGPQDPPSPGTSGGSGGGGSKWRVPFPTVEALFEHAVALQPSNATLIFGRANAFKTIANLISDTPSLSLERNSVHSMRKRWMKAIHACAALDVGKYSPTVYHTMGDVLKMMGKDKESERAYRRALKLRPPLQTLLDAATATARASSSAASSSSSYTVDASSGNVADANHVDDVRLQAALAKWNRLEEHQRETGEGIVTGLHTVLLQQGARKATAKRTVQQLAMLIGVWDPKAMPHPQQLPKQPSSRPMSFACPWHKRERYSGLVSAVEEAASEIEDEMMGLLQMRADGDAAELAGWYADHERIVSRPQIWMRRHASCDTKPFMKRFERTCTAVDKALRWYYHPAEPRRFYRKAQWSILLSGAHVRPHHGPTNERLVLSLGLAGANGAVLRVGNVTRRWSVGRAHLFDDAFEHEVKVGPDQPRAVLIMHFDQPELAEEGTTARRIGQSRHELCDQHGAEAVDEDDL